MFGSIGGGGDGGSVGGLGGSGAALRMGVGGHLVDCVGKSIFKRLRSFLRGGEDEYILMAIDRGCQMPG